MKPVMNPAHPAPYQAPGPRSGEMPLRRALLTGGVAVGALALGGLAGCGGLGGPGRSTEFFVLDDLHPAFAAPGAPTAAVTSPTTLLIAGGTTPTLYDSDRMVYTRDGVGHAYYQYANWSERPLRRLLTLAERRLALEAGVQAVAPSVSGVRGDLLLTIYLDELVHDHTTQPGEMRLGTRAELLNWRRRTLLARRDFQLTAPLTRADARGANQAANQALTAWLDILTPWVKQAVAGLPAPTAGASTPSTPGR